MNLSHSSAKAYHVDYYFHTLEEEAVLGIYIYGLKYKRGIFSYYFSSMTYE